MKRLTQAERDFCNTYATDPALMGNGTQSYITAFSLDSDNTKDVRLAKDRAYRLLRRPEILYAIREALQSGELSSEIVDQELSFLITQHADLSVKLSAIREYNRVHRKVEDKISALEEQEKRGQFVVEVRSIDRTQEQS